MSILTDLSYRSMTKYTNILQSNHKGKTKIQVKDTLNTKISLYKKIKHNSIKTLHQISLSPNEKKKPSKNNVVTKVAKSKITDKHNVQTTRLSLEQSNDKQNKLKKHQRNKSLIEKESNSIKTQNFTSKTLGITNKNIQKSLYKKAPVNLTISSLPNQKKNSVNKKINYRSNSEKMNSSKFKDQKKNTFIHNYYKQKKVIPLKNFDSVKMNNNLKVMNNSKIKKHYNIISSYSKYNSKTSRKNLSVDSTIKKGISSLIKGRNKKQDIKAKLIPYIFKTVANFPNSKIKIKPKTKNLNSSLLSLKQNLNNILTEEDKEQKEKSNMLQDNSFLSKLPKTRDESPKEQKFKKTLQIESHSQPGYSDKTHRKINQDSFFINGNLFDIPEQYIIGICDGHGIYGHFCSEYISNHFPLKISSLNKPSCYSLSSYLTESFISLNSDLTNNKQIDTIFSGTTLTTILLLYDKLICANVGDSKGLLTRYDNGNYSYIELSRSHTPDEKDEGDRIIKNGGTIHPLIEKESNKEKGRNRIWLGKSEIPGIAMTRTMGDEIAHTMGVISEPDIKEVYYDGNEKFIILASDGVWDVISSEESVNIIKSYYENGNGVQGAVMELVEEALKRWRKEESVIEDITAVVVFFA